MHATNLPFAARLSPTQPAAGLSVLEMFAVARGVSARLRGGAANLPLNGRNVALLTDDAATDAPCEMHAATLELGARVSLVRFVRPSDALPSETDPFSRALGRMYDAIVCGALPPAMQQALERNAGIPVFAGLDRDDHLLRVLADLMTLYDHPLPPGTTPTIRFVGQPWAPMARAFISIARHLGFKVTLADEGQTASNDPAFVVDSTVPGAWSLTSAWGPLDEKQRLQNHRRIIQAALLEGVERA